MRILGWKDERENFHGFCHFFSGVIVYALAWLIHRPQETLQFWPVIVLGIGWELLDTFFGSMVSWLDSRGFSIGDVVWTILGGCLCIKVLS